LNNSYEFNIHAKVHPEGTATARPVIKTSPQPLPAVVCHIPELKDVVPVEPPIVTCELGGVNCLVPQVDVFKVICWLVIEKENPSREAAFEIMALNQIVEPAGEDKNGVLPLTQTLVEQIKGQITGTAAKLVATKHKTKSTELKATDMSKSLRFFFLAHVVDVRLHVDFLLSLRFA
jgi:hypothetical protein